ncbi:hypothetical protein GMES_0247 [Paraglaciecola mesophila KMM 241]|uniref:Uncharacterized protein n=1 Tax=Paraglaciecola mesophila KMM 241 TaxID=1128912 RepID=K6YEZ9_9ALTE|nr:hypothetical protein GMES_0247 [Paraglaciecola mesophila KMM 241]
MDVVDKVIQMHKSRLYQLNAFFSLSEDVMAIIGVIIKT